jgi:uncharacterized phage-associated protein
MEEGTAVETALEVAGYLLKLAAEEPEPEFLSHMRLQKLLYYVQGWSLGVRGHAMFESPIEAWRHGPVVRDVFPHFADYGDNPIPFSRAGTGAALARADRDFIASIWESYKGYSAAALRSKTHAEPPWLLSWGTRGSDERCDEIIPHDVLAAFFRSEYERYNRHPSLGLDVLARAEADFKAGRGVPLTEPSAAR